MTPTLAEVARHEAAHAVIAVDRGLRLRSVTVSESEGGSVTVLCTPRKDMSLAACVRHAEGQILSALAGGIVGGGLHNDHDGAVAKDLSNARFPESEKAALMYLVAMNTLVEDLLVRPATVRAIETVTVALLKTRRLSGREVHALVTRATTWKCGHPRTPENTKPHAPYGRCRTCQQSHDLRYALAPNGRDRQDRYENTIGGIFGRANRGIHYHLAGARGRLAELGGSSDVIAALRAHLVERGGRR